VEENVTVKTKSPTSEERWEDPGLINGGAAHPFRLTFWGEGNGPVTFGITASVKLPCRQTTADSTSPIQLNLNSSPYMAI